VSGSTATINYSINRGANQVASRSCALAGPTTTTACGSQIGSTKTSTSYQAGLTNLTPGSYSYSVRFTLTDGGRGSGSTTFTISKLNQTISFSSTNPSPVVIGDPTYTPAATASSGLTVAISLDGSSSGCSLSAGVVSLTGVGTCLVDANQAGNGTYSAASQVQQSITVGSGKQDQTITFAPTTYTSGDTLFTVSASATSQLTVAFSIDASTSSVCTISGTTVDFLTAGGTCTVDANQSGDSNWNPAPQVQQSVAYSSGGGGGGGGGGGCAVTNLAIVQAITHGILHPWALGGASVGRYTARTDPWLLSMSRPWRIPDVTC
jgi:hypothetical protein